MDNINNSTDAQNKSINYFKETLQWIYAILIALVVALLIRAFIFELVLVQGESMQDTLQNNQRLVVYKLGYYLSPPKHGDIIILMYQEGTVGNIPYVGKSIFFRKLIPDFKETDYVKRVI